MRNIKYWISILTAALLPASTSIAAEWTELFNGTDLAHWENPYDWGKVEIVNGEIHLTTDKSKWFLSTVKEYSDFIFEVEVKMPEGKCNSGFLFRSHKLRNKMFGYQAEVDPSDRKWSGGLYDEGRRGWFISPNRDHANSTEAKQQSIAAFRKRAGDCFKRYGWNKYRIECRGDHIKISINGVTTTDIYDQKDAKGYIGLQHHGEKGQIYRFRNVRIMELTDESTVACSSSSEWISLFASGDFSDWTNIKGQAVSEGWSIENGIIHRSGKRSGDIITRTHYKNFELRFGWKISAAGNSGVKYRTRGRLGLEYQILDDDKHQDSKNPTHRAGSLYELVAAPDNKPIQAVGEWNHARIVAKGNHIEHWLNGQKVVELEYGTKEWNKKFQNSKYKKHEGFGGWTGPILLQDHDDEVWFQNVQIREL
ncbi:MAG: DUF1080 domain-containing protein [Opitutae bacterium]|nr:DUF1080 domain-containing protein [Opitutae bacterium]